MQQVIRSLYSGEAARRPTGPEARNTTNAPRTTRLFHLPSRNALPRPKTAMSTEQLQARANDDTALQPPTTSSGGVQTRGETSDQVVSTKKKRTAHCKFYATKAGCRLGESCPFVHDPNDLLRGQSSSRTTHEQRQGQSVQTTRPQQQINSVTRRHVPFVDPSRVVQRPNSNIAQSPEVRRKNEIGQLKRRWGSQLVEEDEAYRITLKQSEEFPYDLDALHIALTVPVGYLAIPGARPSIRVLNDDIPKGHQINIERGFAELVENASSNTRLLDLVNALDNKLEFLLGTEKATTIKIVPNLDPIISSTAKPKIRDEPFFNASTQETIVLPAFDTFSTARTFSDDEKIVAQERRVVETRQLEARFRQTPIFKKSGDGEEYTVPLEPRKRALLPAALQNLRMIKLIVPKLYPLEPCEALLINAGADNIAKAVSRKFKERVKENGEISLMGHLNYLAQNIHALAVDDPPELQATTDALKDLKMESAPESEDKAPAFSILGDIRGKSHIAVIARPPDWNYHPSEDDYSEDDSSGDESLEDGIPGDDPLANETKGESKETEKNEFNTIERGTSISFPGIKLGGIEVLELRVVNITIKCSRCKSQLDISGIKAREGKFSRPKLLGCDKCSNVLGIDFRKELIHEHNLRAGFFDLSGCTVVDLLPSDFIPTCSSCSSTLPAPGIVGLARASTRQTNCRNCFQKLSVFIPEVRFLKISNEDETALNTAEYQADFSALSRLVDLGTHGFDAHKKKESLGLVAGTELPLRGRCAHYRKSTRWFRFACCNKVYPCDRCHDDLVEPHHKWEHANRMICGMCSREQTYMPERCAFCGHSFVSRNSGFWEGGKGTRDKVAMSRKDPRKYKRRDK